MQRGCISREACTFRRNTMSKRFGKWVIERTIASALIGWKLEIIGDRLATTPNTAAWCVCIDALNIV